MRKMKMRKNTSLFIVTLIITVFMLFTLTNCYPMHRGLQVTAKVNPSTVEIDQIVNFKGIITEDGNTVQSKLYDLSGVKTEFEKFEWDFGDGETKTNTTSLDATHSYVKPGEYNIKFTVYTKDGRTKSATSKVTVLKIKKPSNLTLTDSINSIKLSWQNNSNSEKGFTIQRKINETQYSTLTTVSSSTFSYVDTNVSTYTTYYYRVRAYNNNGISDWTDQVMRTGYAKLVLSTTSISKTIDSNTSTQTTFLISNEGERPLTYKITKTSTSWLTISSTSGTIDTLNNKTITIKLDPTGLKYGTYNGNIFIESNDPAGTQTIAVQMKINFYTVSGTVKDSSGNGIEDVKITLVNKNDDSITYTATSDSDGNWSKSGLSGTFTITPSKSGYQFTPVSTQVSSPKVINFVGVKPNWTYSIGSPIESSPAMTEDYGFITVGATDGNLYAINYDGTFEWKYQTGGAIFSSPSVDSNRNHIRVGSDDKKFYGINTFIGSYAWGGTTGGAIRSSAAIDSNKTMYVGSDDGYLYAINDDGTPKWQEPYQTGGAIKSSPAIATVDSTTVVYVGSDDGNLYSIKSSDKSLKWQCKINAPIDSSPAIGSDGTIYVGSDNGYLYAINNSDGSIKWSYQTGGAVKSSPAIGYDGTIYVGSDDGYLYAINSNGTLQWRYQTGGAIKSSPIIATGDAYNTYAVYVGSDDGNLYAINIHFYFSASASPWPMFMNDFRHISNVEN